MSNLVTKETSKEDFNKVYKDYPDTAPQGFQPFHSSRINPIFWDIKENSSVLDVGANSGEFMKMLLERRKGVKVKGIDLSEVAVQKAKEKGLDVILGDGESLPFEDASFDYVVLMEVIVHVHDPKKLLKEIKRVLKKDGVLLGSAPHKNLEMNIWDDQRLHHAYYTTEELSDLLYGTFQAVYTKVLKGGQFSMGMAGTYLGDKDCEILFKCGSSYIQPWDYQLLDKDRLKVWMGPTQTPGDVYYRMSGYADKMNKLERTDVLYDRFTESEDSMPGAWQKALIRGDNGMPSNMIVVNQLDGLLKISDMSVWQLTAIWDVLAFYQCVKGVYKNKPFITEIDDWFFDVPSYNLASNPYKPNSDPEKIAFEQIEMSDAIICSTQYIKDSILKLFPNKPIYVVPNSIDFDVWDNVPAAPNVLKQDGRIRIGYTGSGNHGGDLEMIKDVIISILNDFPDVEFICAGTMSSDMKGKPFVINHDRSYFVDRWTPISQWPAACKGWNIDIGIAPLRDSHFNRAKSNLRWLEYSAIKVPTIASKIVPFESIKDGKDGILCTNQRQWYEALKTLIQDEKKRKSLGETAYLRCKKESNMNKVAKTYKSILEAIKGVRQK